MFTKKSAQAMPAPYGKFILDEGSGERDIPYVAQIDDETITSRTHDYLQIIELTGVHHETLSAEQYNLKTALRNLLYRTIADPNIGLWHTLIRSKHTPEKPALVLGGFCNQLHEAYWEKVSDEDWFTNRHFLTVIVKRSSNKIANISERLRSTVSGHNKAIYDREHQSKLTLLKKTVDTVCARLAHYKPRVLTTTLDVKGRAISEPQTFLFELINGVNLPIYLGEQSILSHKLLTSRVIAGTTDGSVSHPIKRRYFKSLAIKEMDKTTITGDLDSLLTLPFEFVATSTFAFKTRADTLDQLDRQQRQLIKADDHGVSEIAEITEAMDAVVSGEQVFGEHYFSLMIYADERENLGDHTKEASAALADARMVPIEDDYFLWAKYYAQLPTNWRYLTRVKVISSLNFAALSTFHNYGMGAYAPRKWGEPIAVLSTPAKSPYYLALHESEDNEAPGNTTLVGTTGTGKTVLLTFLAAMSQQYGARVVLFDKDRGAEIFVRASGGAYHMIQRGVPTGLNPCGLADTDSNRAFLYEFLVNLFEHNGTALTPPQKEYVFAMVELNFVTRKGDQRLSHLASALPRHATDNLYIRFSEWIGDGPNAWLFDSPKETVSFKAHNIQGFDLTEILDKPGLRGPCLHYLSYRVDESLDGQPAMIMLDEGWKAASDPGLSKMIFNWEKTIRKKNGIVLFATNSANDCGKTDVGREIIEQSSMKIFSMNPDASRKAYVEDFGLSEYEYQIIRETPTELRLFLFKRKSGESALASLDLSGLDKMIQVLSGTESNLQTLDRVTDSCGKEPEQFLDAYWQALHRFRQEQTDRSKNRV